MKQQRQQWPMGGLSQRRFSFCFLFLHLSIRVLYVRMHYSSVGGWLVLDLPILALRIFSLATALSRQALFFFRLISFSFGLEKACYFAFFFLIYFFLARYVLLDRKYEICNRRESRGRRNKWEVSVMGCLGVARLMCVSRVSGSRCFTGVKRVPELVPVT